MIDMSHFVILEEFNVDDDIVSDCYVFIGLIT